MIEADTIILRGAWERPAADMITLDEAQRHRRRMAMVSDGGIAFLLDLAQAHRLREGDAILLSDGRLLEVRAKPEPLLAVEGRDPAHLLQIAWQIGNRHLPCQIEASRLLLRRDHVVEAMLRELGARVESVEAPFDPEGGAYALPGAAHAHTHHHD